MDQLCRYPQWLLMGVFMAAMAAPGYAQNDASLIFNARLSAEHRNNITRVPDSLQRADLRSNLLLGSEYRRTLFQKLRWSGAYELRYHRYRDESTFDRHEHTVRTSFSLPLFDGVRFYAADEFRLRLHPGSESFDYRRNTVDLSLKFPFLLKSSLYIGYLNWTKVYPNSSRFRDYLSNRFYTRVNRRVIADINFSMKAEVQAHRGNVFPGTTAPDQLLNLESTRYVLNITLDKIINRKVLAGISWRYETDEPDVSDVVQGSAQISDEDAEELLADDSDFGYDKNQVALSTLIRFNSRFSFITFYVAQRKNFEFWRVRPGGPKRTDSLVFFSNLLKIHIANNLGLQFQFNFEHNDTNVGAYDYDLTAVSAGLYWSR